MWLDFSLPNKRGSLDDLRKDGFKGLLWAAERLGGRGNI